MWGFGCEEAYVRSQSLIYSLTCSPVASECDGKANSAFSVKGNSHWNISAHGWKAASLYLKSRILCVHYGPTHYRISLQRVSLSYLSHFPCEKAFLTYHLTLSYFFPYAHLLIPRIYLSSNSRISPLYLAFSGSKSINFRVDLWYKDLSAGKIICSLLYEVNVF